jgi:hypothetical protein
VKVFVSHFSGDTWVARQICKEIEQLGVETFLDAADIQTGDVFEEAIRQNLQTCDELLVLLTPAALTRPYVWMEIGTAWLRQKRIVGILYGLTGDEISTGERTPALLKGMHMRDLNDLDLYLAELRDRSRR